MGKIRRSKVNNVNKKPIKHSNISKKKQGIKKKKTIVKVANKQANKNKKRANELAKIPNKKAAAAKRKLRAVENNQKQQEHELRKKKRAKIIEIEEDNDDINDESDDIEMDYEKIPRKNNWAQKETLMTKALDGTWHKQEKNIVDNEMSDEEMSSDDDDEMSDDEEEEEEKIMNKIKKPMNEREVKNDITKKRKMMASIAAEVMANPEKRLSKIEDLQLWIDDTYHIIIRQLAMASLTEILVDLIPGYRIHVTDNKDIELSKDVLKLQKYESLFLLHYKRLISKIHNVLKDAKHKKVSEKFGTLALKCACRLLESGYHFNLRSELIAAVVPKLNHANQTIRQVARQAVEKVFCYDTTGDAAVEIAKRISKLVKSRTNIKCDVIDCLLVIPFSYDVLRHSADDVIAREKIHVDPKLSKKQRAKQRKEKIRQRKLEEQELQRDLEQSSAIVSLDHRKRAQTGLLTEVFTTYFRVLKGVRQTELLSSVLRGLAKFAHYINMELVLDLLEYLKVVISESLPLESTLNCIIAAFETLSHHPDAITIDLKHYYDRCYQMLLLINIPDNYKHIPLLLRAMELLFRDRARVPIPRVSAFVARILLMIPHTPPYISLALLHLVRRLCITFPKLNQFFDNEAFASGAYLAESLDSDYANGLAMVPWQLSLLSKSFHPFLATIVNNMSSNNNNNRNDTILRMKPMEIYENFDSSTGAFNPPISSNDNNNNFDINTLNNHDWFIPNNENNNNDNSKSSSKKMKNSIAKHWKV